MRHVNRLWEPRPAVTAAQRRDDERTAAPVTVRFYGALNDFLPPARRRVRFVHPLRAAASVKDTIEALGVPHPEVDVIILNGVAVDFGAIVHDGDDLAVYPRFETLPVDAIVRVGVEPPDPPRFAIDIHLTKLAALLRLAGFDSVVIADDAELARVGAGEERVVLTRDVALLKRGIIRSGHWVRSTDPEWQLVEVLQRFRLAGRLVPFSRCTQCNTPLIDATAEAVADRLEACTRAQFSEFRECPGCRRVYWQGSHYAPLQAALDRALRRAASQSSGAPRP